MALDISIAEAFRRGPPRVARRWTLVPTHRGWPVGKASADAPSKYGHHGRICSLPSFSGDADAGWRRRIIGHEEGGRERLARVHAVFLEVGDALGGEEGVVIRKLPVKLRDGLWNTRYAASAMICGVRDIRITRSPPSRFLMAAVAMVVRGHSALT